jgi:hypothetical protein
VAVLEDVLCRGAASVAECNSKGETTECSV